VVELTPSKQVQLGDQGSATLVPGITFR
jgi:hypothetical protein